MPSNNVVPAATTLFSPISSWRTVRPRYSSIKCSRRHRASAHEAGVRSGRTCRNANRRLLHHAGRSCPGPSCLPAAPFGGSPVSFSLYAEDCDSLYRKALEAGAVSEREPADQPYGDRTAGVLDPFGYRWYFATLIKDMTEEELEQLPN